MQYGIRNSKRIGFLICNFCIALTGCINATFVLKITQISVKLDFKLATIWPIFLAISRTSFLARNVSQNHFPFSREMREMCKSSVERGCTSCIFSGQEVILYAYMMSDRWYHFIQCCQLYRVSKINLGHPVLHCEKL